jgi:hypothetical protein
MVGYSALAQKNEALSLELLEEYRQILPSIFPRYGEGKHVYIGFTGVFPIPTTIGVLSRMDYMLVETLDKENLSESCAHRECN